MKITRILIFLIIVLSGSVLIYTIKQPSDTIVGQPPIDVQNRPIESETESTQLAGEERHYLFNIQSHSPEEIKMLLERAEYLSSQAESDDENIKIAMVMHGPDMDIFDKKNYQKHMEIVDLAARLEASGVIDFKVCKTVATIRGIPDGSFPSFIEMVPFAPDELDKLEQQGFIEL